MRGDDACRLSWRYVEGESFDLGQEDDLGIVSRWIRADGLTSGALAEVLTDYALDPTIAFVIFPRPGSPHTRRECSPTIFSEP